MRELTVLADFDPGGEASSLSVFDPCPPSAPTTGYLTLPFVAALRACQACSARPEARQVVPGAGPVEALGMVIGQNPGVDEDREGVPFIGAGGEELDRWLRLLGLDRAKLVVTNVVKCHTTNNRLPKLTEQRTCVANWLMQELEALSALQVLFPVGKPAVTAILGKQAPPMTPLAAHHYLVRLKPTGRELHVFPLPHPAFLLRARHLGPLMQTVLTHVRLTLEQEVPSAYALMKR